MLYLYCVLESVGKYEQNIKRIMHKFVMNIFWWFENFTAYPVDLTANLSKYVNKESWLLLL